MVVGRSENPYSNFVSNGAGICIVLQCDWTKTRSSKNFRVTLIFSSRDHASPARLSFALSMVHTMNARRFQRTHPLSGMGECSLNASKEIGMGIIDFALACGSKPVADDLRFAVVGSDRTRRVLDAGSGREDRSSERTRYREQQAVSRRVAR